MKPEKIANLEQRLKRWHQERAKWLYQEAPITLLIGVMVCSVLMYIGSFSEPSLKSTWFFWGTIFGIGFALTHIKMEYPKKPTQKDVEADINLRKAFEMDATVSGEEEKSK